MKPEELLKNVKKGDTFIINESKNCDSVVTPKHEDLIDKFPLKVTVREVTRDDFYKFQKGSILTNIGSLDLFRKKEKTGIRGGVMDALRKIFKVEDVDVMTNCTLDNREDVKLSLVKTEKDKVYLIIEKTLICEIKSMEKV